MRIGHEDKGAAPMAPQFRECVVRHSWYKGASCDECGLRIPIGPYTSQQMAEYFGAGIFLNGRPISEPTAAELAHPITDREVALAKEHAELTEQIIELKAKLSRGDGRRQTGAVQTIIDALTGRPVGADRDETTQTTLLIAEARWDEVNRKLRAERAQRAGRMRGWIARRS